MKLLDRICDWFITPPDDGDELLEDRCTVCGRRDEEHSRG